MRIGILGGGQLGCMLAESLYTLGADIAVYDPDPDAPLCRRTSQCTNAAWDDQTALRQFARSCDRLTYEFENVESQPLTGMAHLWPSLAVLVVTQHRGREKRFLQAHGLPHVAFHEVDGPEALRAILDGPSIVKTLRGGYDGKGQLRLDPGDPVPALAWPCVVEERLALEREVSCVVARSREGEAAVFPVFENVHEGGILDLTIVPAELPDSVRATVQSLAVDMAARLDVTGLLTSEFFLTRTRPRRSLALEVDGWYVMVNELAPRPHNSAHVTRKACTFSQFDALARILLDVPLGTPELVTDGVWGMGNLLGDVYGRRAHLDLSPWRQYPDVLEVCLYGKKQPRPGRKMGHFLLRGTTASQVRDRIQGLRQALSEDPIRIA